MPLIDLHGAQAGRGISGEEGVADAGGEDDHAAFLEVAHGAAANVGLGDLIHEDRGHDPALHAALFKRVLQGDGVDDGGEHAHVVGADAVHFAGLLGHSAEDVASADDDGDLDAEFVDVGNFRCGFGHFFCVQTESAGARQGFARKLENDPFVHIVLSIPEGREWSVVSDQMEGLGARARKAWGATLASGPLN